MERTPDTDAPEPGTGAREPAGHSGRAIAALAAAWSLFQLWYASPLPYQLNFAILNSTEARSIHLAFALTLAYLAYPALRGRERPRIPWYDLVLAVAGAACAAYLFVFQDALSQRPGSPTTADLVIAVAGMVLLLEAARRSLGLPLVIIALVFIGYMFFGSAAWLPDVIQWQGASLARAMSHQWLTTEGVFGVPIGVSTRFVFLFVLFGALLERAGAGLWFIRVAFALLGGFRGGPAKAAVLASGMTGIISGSSIANVVTTGTFTIPLMRRVGFSANKAGAVEVASSVNGQLMPPVMGAAAFLMVEFLGIPYIDVIRHALLPAVISYVALLYMVHLEAVKADMRGLPRSRPRTLYHIALTWGLIAAGLIILSAAVYYGIGWIHTLAGDAATAIIIVGIAAAYVGLLAIAAREAKDTGATDDGPITELPEPGPTARAGLQYLLPVVVLIWFLLVERRSPNGSAFWALVTLIAIVITQRPLLAWFRGEKRLKTEIVAGLRDFGAGLIQGARNMIGIGVATATAGIIVGTVTLTGVGQVMTEFVEFLSGGHLLPMLMMTAVICVVLGMGLPTTANYIVVSSLMAPVIVTLAGDHGLIVPMIAVHLFVFYFGIMADVTPPVGLASYAAAAVSGGDPIRTGIYAFWYSLRMAILPFLFVFNTELLLIDIGGFWHLLGVIASATAGILLLAAFLQGWMFTRLRILESAAVLLAAFTLFYPSFWMDRIVPPYEERPATELRERVTEAPAGAELRVVVEREDFDGNQRHLIETLELGELGDFETRMNRAGLMFVERDGDTWTAEPQFGGEFEDERYVAQMRIEGIRIQQEQPPAQWFFLPAVLVAAGAIWTNRRRARQFESG